MQTIQKCRDINGGRTRARTWDPLIKSQLLNDLSCAAAFFGHTPVTKRSVWWSYLVTVLPFKRWRYKVMHAVGGPRA